MEQMIIRANKSSRRPRRSLNNRRYSARYLILVYRTTPERFDPLEIHRLVSQEEGQCTIVRQLQADDTSSYLAFVDFAGKRFQTRNPSLFDIQGLHPKWLHVRSSPWETLDTMVAGGEVIWNGISRDKKPAAQIERPGSASKGVSPAQWEYLGSSSNESNILELCKEYIAAHDSNASDAGQLRQPSDHHEQTEISREVEFWREGYRAGYSDGLSHNQGRQNTNSISQFDSESLRLLSEVNHPPQQPGHFSEETIPQAPVHEILDIKRWSPDDLEPLDWECTDLSAIAFPPS